MCPRVRHPRDGRCPHPPPFYLCYTRLHGHGRYITHYTLHIFGVSLDSLDSSIGLRLMGAREHPSSGAPSLPSPPSLLPLPSSTHAIPLYDFGGRGPPILALHANGFNGATYAPMVGTACGIDGASGGSWSFPTRCFHLVASYPRVLIPMPYLPPLPSPFLEARARNIVRVPRIRGRPPW